MYSCCCCCCCSGMHWPVVTPSRPRPLFCTVGKASRSVGVIPRIQGLPRLRAGHARCPTIDPAGEFFAYCCSKSLVLYFTPIFWQTVRKSMRRTDREVRTKAAPTCVARSCACVARGSCLCPSPFCAHSKVPLPDRAQPARCMRCVCVSLILTLARHHHGLARGHKPSTYRATRKIN